jgi:hypothetical protein
MLLNLTLIKGFNKDQFLIISYHIVKEFVCIRQKSELAIHCAEHTQARRARRGTAAA